MSIHRNLILSSIYNNLTRAVPQTRKTLTDHSNVKILSNGKIFQVANRSMEIPCTPLLHPGAQLEYPAMIS